MATLVSIIARIIVSVVVVSGVVAVVESAWEDDGVLAGHYHCCYSYGEFTVWVMLCRWIMVMLL